jgi:hypothetical protein
MLNDPNRYLLERIAAVLSPTYKIIKVVFDLYVIAKGGITLRHEILQIAQTSSIMTFMREDYSMCRR